MKLIRKQPSSQTGSSKHESAFNRRTFLKRSGLTASGAAVAGSIPLGLMRRRAEAQSDSAPKQSNVEVKRTVCSHCSVGCGAIAHVENGVWVKQEPDFDSPLNLGAHCAKGASLRYHGMSEKRVRYPMKLVDGEWTRLSWEQAVEEIGDQFLKIREESGPDSVWWCGSSKANNEGAYLQRKFAAFWGTNNIDHQARICHSTTVAGVANTWGYGAMTNSYNDMHNCKSMLFVGSNAAEAHPVAMQHVLRGKENGAKMIVVDPRFTRTAAHADQFMRIRPGTDVPLIWGMLWHVFQEGWEDKEYIKQRVYGMDEIRAEVAKWTPEIVHDVTGIPAEEVKRAARTLAENRPGTIVWCMGGTQHTIGNNNTRAYCALQLALGNIGVSGGGANIFRGHDNVQGATDLGVLSHTLPGYYGLADGSWKHWAKVWDVDYEWLRGRFDTAYAKAGNDQGKVPFDNPMNSAGIPVSRWIDGVLEDAELIDQRDQLKAMFFFGHAPNSQTRGPEMKKAMETLELLVVVDPYPTHTAVLPDRQEGMYLLPAATQFETYGSVTASNRSLQWRERIMEPLFEALPDHTIMYKLARKLGFEDKLTKNMKVENDEPLVEDILREINRGMWTIGYTGQSPERLKLHLENKHTFNTTTLKAEGGPCDGD